MENKKKHVGFLRIAKWLLGVLFLAIGFTLAAVLLDYGRMRGHNDRISRLVVRLPSEDSEAAGTSEDYASSFLPTVDFEALKQINEDCVGWIYACGGEISYPVVAAEDEYYLRHAFDGTYLRSGTIFVDSGSDKPFLEERAVLYGHNMKDGSMFHSLLQYHWDKDYLAENPYIYILTEDGVYQYEISRVSVAEYENIAAVAEREEDRGRKLELITCEYSGKNTRLLVEAWLIEEGERNNGSDR